MFERLRRMLAHEPPAETAPAVPAESSPTPIPDRPAELTLPRADGFDAAGTI